MRRVTISFIIWALFICGSAIFAETIVESGEVSGTWSTENSPYLIQGEINVPAGDSLFIELGVDVLFQGWYALTVSGFLETSGRPDMPIIFAPQDSGSWWGGLRFVGALDSSLLNYCVLEYGRATSAEPRDRGGALYIKDTSPSVTYTTIRESRAVEYGGAVYSENASPVFEYCTITENQGGSEGGGLYFMNSEPAIRYSRISDNTLALSGGFSAVHGKGGGLFFDNSPGDLRYNLITNNSVEANGNVGSTAEGGGIYAEFSDLVLVGNTLSGNTTAVNVQDGDGGGLYLTGADPLLVDNILWDNAPQEIFFATDGIAASVMVAYSDIEAGQSGIVAGSETTIHWEEGNININPQFVNPAQGNFELASGSACIDTGTAYFEWNSEVIVDLSADQYAGSAPEMGALEFGIPSSINQAPIAHASADRLEGSAPFTVSFFSSGSEDPDGEINQYHWDFDDGETSAEPNPVHTFSDTGFYYVRLKVIDDDGFAHRTVLRIHVERGTHIVGGEVAGRWTAPESPFFIDGDVTIPAGDTLIIDPGVQVVFTGQYAFSVSGYLSAFGWGDSTITFAPEDSTGWWGGLRFLESPDTSELRQCIIERGSAIGTEPYDRGGGIYIQGANPRITHSIIRENRASMYGGGIYCEDASPYIGNCTVEANSVFYGSSGAGGGIYTINSTPNILGSQIIDNTVGLSGGFSTADGSGGGVYLENSDAILPYNLIAGNSVEVSGNVGSSAQGGGISALQSDLEVINNTISGNITTINGIADTGSVLYLSGSYPKIFNSILWGNSSSRIKIADANADSLLIAFSDIEGGQDSIDAEGEFTLFWEQGNISENPLFIDPGNGNYHLAEGSPCINNGTSWFEWEGELLLFIPSMNYAGPAPDMGAFESDVIDAIDTRTTAPQSLELFQNYPNPFNPETIITYGLPRKMSVQLTIYDLAGHTVRELVSEYQQAGWHHIRWNGKDKYGRSVSTGVYLYRLRAGEYEKIRKMMCVK